LEEADALFERALGINPSNADAMVLWAELDVIAGRPSRGVERVLAAMRFNPYPPTWYAWHLGFARYADGDYAGAVDALKRDAALQAPFGRILAASYAQLGEAEKAKEAAARFLGTVPNFTIAGWLRAQRLRSEVVAQRFIDGYRKAGLPH